MITVDEPNVHVYRTEGNTDEQAEALKLLFEDAPFMQAAETWGNARGLGSGI